MLPRIDSGIIRVCDRLLFGTRLLNRKMIICEVCKSSCRTSLSSASLFSVQFHPSFAHYMIVPCNVRLEFNELITENSVVFQGGGAPYTSYILKGSTKTKLYGDDWGRFITFNKIDYSEQMIHFSLSGESPFIFIYYVGSDEDPFDDAIFAQRLKLSEQEVENLLDRLPQRESYNGVPFVARLTKTNLEGQTMKLPKILAEKCGIEVHGEGMLAGLRLGGGAITTSTYKVDPVDGRIILGTEGRWKNFLNGKNLMVEQAIIITIRNQIDANLRMMVVGDII